jgi:RNA polymerase sigma factor (sigma-70 family)
VPVETDERQSASSEEVRLFETLRSGDRAALGGLYRLHGRTVYAAAIAVLRSRTDAEEIMQDAFVTLWTRRSSITLVGESVLPWLVTTARYLALNRTRSLARRRTDGLDDAASIESRRRSPEDEVLLGELRTQLDQAIAGLSELDRSIIDLCLTQNLSYKEAAVRLGVSQASIRNRLSRVRARLRATLTTQEEK